MKFRTELYRKKTLKTKNIVILQVCSTAAMSTGSNEKFLDRNEKNYTVRKKKQKTNDKICWFRTLAPTRSPIEQIACLSSSSAACRTPLHPPARTLSFPAALKSSAAIEPRSRLASRDPVRQVCVKMQQSFKKKNFGGASS